MRGLLKEMNTKMNKLNKFAWKLTKYVTLPLVGLLVIVAIASPAKAKADFVGSYYNWIPETPATGVLWITVENVSDVDGVAECSILLRDSSYHYKARDIATTGEIKAGQSRRFYLDMVVTNEGSMYVDTLDIECEAK